MITSSSPEGDWNGHRSWVFQSNPDNYDLRGAIKAQDEDTWLVTRYRNEIAPGDIVFLWESGKEGGICGVGMISDYPSIRTKAKRFIKSHDKLGGRKLRVGFEILKAVEPVVSREDVKSHRALASLSIIKAPQGTNFKVVPDQSKALAGLVGGLSIDPDVDDIVKTLEERSTGRSPRQGFNVPVGARRAVEDHAMKQAMAYFTQQEWNVEDVHGQESYDLRCLKRGQELHVEVKGTSSAGLEIVLTRNEVAHARHFPAVALYVLAEVVWKSTRRGYRAKGGREFIYNPWRIDDGKLKPLAYTYKPPKIRPDHIQEEPHAYR